ncbi:sodium-dependent transporter [Paenibacillus sp. MSJ-34]|uniref:sodium-dependent transporter n=1 Tax=Paenibacillus sp. MSJ-34 TaxID=2841529 RepID=UPI001C0F4617|nr:sodium-dependent transporter [Paenibacillus sp. MSJ-34]
MGHSKKQHKGSAGERFSSAGFILAAIGSAVGLGNMWKFPYITGQNGGAAFFLIFLAFLAIIGLPVLLAELTIGRGGRGDAAASFRNLSNRPFWHSIGLLLVLGSFFILTFYSVVAGWTIHYAVQSLGGGLYRSADYGAVFERFTGGAMPVVWLVVVLAGTCWIVMRGVSGGIEKFNNVVIPGLFILLLLLMGYALTLPGAGAGIRFFLKPEFSELTVQSVLMALGQAFFSLSVGSGAMMTYGSYTDQRQSLGGAAIAIGSGNALYALMAGLIIFPTTFSFGIEPASGPGLVFIALPAAFSSMPFGSLFGGLFFVLLAIAALTSAVSLLEVPVAYAMNRWGRTRGKTAVAVTAACFAVALPCALSAGGVWSGVKAGGRTIFEWVDFITSNIMLPAGGLIITVFAGYVWDQAGKEAGLTAVWYRLWIVTLRYIAPVLILLIFLYSTGII